MSHLVAMLIGDGVNLLDIAGPLQAFSAVNRIENVGSLYEIVLASDAGGPVATGIGIPVLTQPLSALEGRSISTLIVPGAAHGEAPATLVEFIRRRAPNTERICSICAGVFMLAEAGLLEDRRAATHWDWTEQFRARFPRIRLDSTAIFVRDGRIWTSAGLTAAIDLALALIEDDFGHATSLAVAKQLVMFLKRPGCQSQLSAVLASQAAANPILADLYAWMAGHLKEDLRIERLAERCGMSPRTFSRAYIAQTGETPGRTVESWRLETARRALESGTASLKRVAVEAGFRDEQNLRRAFLRRLGITPLEYRERLSTNLSGISCAFRRYGVSV